MQILRIWIVVISLLAVGVSASAQSRLAGVFSDGEHTLRIAPAPIESDRDWVYVEVVAAGNELEPLVQQLWMLDAGAGEAAMYTFPESSLDRYWPALGSVYVGAWAAPERFPAIDPGSLIPMGVADLRTSADGAFSLTTTRPMIFHRDDASRMTLTVQADQTITWFETRMDDAGVVMLERNLTLPRIDDETSAHVTEQGLVIIDLRVGPGPELEAGDTALIGYSMYRANGQLIDSTSLDDRKLELLQPAPGNFFEGFKQGVLGMHGQARATPPERRHIRRLVVPAHLAFGDKGGQPIIGPNETIIVDLELHTFRDNTR